MTDAKLADAKLSLASGGTVAGPLTVSGAFIASGVRTQTPTVPGVFLEQDSLNGNCGIEVCC